MIWYIISGLAFASAITLLVWMRVRDRRYVKGRILDTMDENLREDVLEEERLAHERHEKFEKLLKDAREGKRPTLSPPL